METNLKINLYEKVAASISQMIDQGTFRPGDRIPYIRAVSRQMQVSVTTAMEAYRLLEDRELIEARPQSGYYVRFISQKTLAEPKPTTPRKKSTSVTIDELVRMVIQESRLPAKSR